VQYGDVKAVVLVEEEIAELGAAKPDGIRQDGVKNRLKLTRQGVDDLKNLGHGSFALQGLLMFGSAGAQFAAQLLDASLEVGYAR